MRASSSPSGESHSTEPLLKRQLHCNRNRRMREPHVRWWGAGEGNPPRLPDPARRFEGGSETAPYGDLAVEPPAANFGSKGAGERSAGLRLRIRKSDPTIFFANVCGSTR